MRKFLFRYFTDDRGAVTIDWVVLTGVLVGFGIAIAAALLPGMMSEADSLDDAVEIKTTF